MGIFDTDIVGYTREKHAGSLERAAGSPTAQFTGISIVKLDSNGVLEWRRTLTPATVGAAIGFGIKVNANKTHVYIAGQHLSGSPPSSNTGVIAKYELNNGTLVWKKTIGESLTAYTQLAIDENENVYAVGATIETEIGTLKILIVKYDGTTGNVIWQRVFGHPSYSSVANGIVIDAENNLLITGYRVYSSHDNSQDMFLLKLPPDGSVTGTYGDFTNEISAIPTNVAPDLKDREDKSLNAISTTLTEQAGSLIDSVGDLPSIRLVN